MIRKRKKIGRGSLNRREEGCSWLVSLSLTQAPLRKKLAKCCVRLPLRWRMPLTQARGGGISPLLSKEGRRYRLRLKSRLQSLTELCDLSRLRLSTILILRLQTAIRWLSRSVHWRWRMNFRKARVLTRRAMKNLVSLRVTRRRRVKRVAKTGTVSYVAIASLTLCSWSAVTEAFAFSAE